MAETQKFFEVIEDQVTPAGIAVFPKIQPGEPDTKFEADGVYSMKIKFDDEADEAALRKLLDEAMQQAFDDAVEQAKTQAKTPKAGEQAAAKVKPADPPYVPEVDRDTGEETGRLLFGFKQKAKVRRARDGKVFEFTVPRYDAGGKAIPDDVEVWGGSKVKVAFEIRPFYTAKVGAGVSLRLRAVQVIDLVSRRPRTADAFGFSPEDGYTAPDAPATPFDKGETEESDEGGDEKAPL